MISESCLYILIYTYTLIYIYILIYTFVLASSTRIFNSERIVNFEKFIFLKAEDQQRDRGGERDGDRDWEKLPSLAGIKMFSCKSVMVCLQKRKTKKLQSNKLTPAGRTERTSGPVNLIPGRWTKLCPPPPQIPIWSTNSQCDCSQRQGLWGGEKG